MPAKKQGKDNASAFPSDQAQNPPENTLSGFTEEVDLDGSPETAAEQPEAEMPDSEMLQFMDDFDEDDPGEAAPVDEDALDAVLNATADNTDAESEATEGGGDDAPEFIPDVVPTLRERSRNEQQGHLSGKKIGKSVWDRSLIDPTLTEGELEKWTELMKAHKDMRILMNSPFTRLSRLILRRLLRSRQSILLLFLPLQTRSSPAIPLISWRRLTALRPCPPLP